MGVRRKMKVGIKIVRSEKKSGQRGEVEGGGGWSVGMAEEMGEKWEGGKYGWREW